MPKRTIKEWITVSKLSRNVGHMFLEGRSDARILRSAFGYPENVDFRSADEVEFEDEDSHPLWGGHKLRLMRFAEFARQEQSSNIRFLIDADFAPFVSHLLIGDNLLQTDAANLPASTLAYNWLNAFFTKGYGAELTPDLWSKIVEILGFTFTARYLSACSDRPKSAPQPSSFLSKKDPLEFDRSSYLVQFFQVGNQSASSIEAEITEIICMADLPIRYIANSNDIFDLIYAVLRRQGKVSGSTPRETIRSAFFAAFDDGVFQSSYYEEVQDWLRKFCA